MRRDYPEPLIALLVFVLGVWLWDHYFGEPLGYAPGTERATLLRIDRDLRLGDAMAEDPAWLRLLAGVAGPDQARTSAATMLETLARDEAISGRGLGVLAVLTAERRGRPASELTAGFAASPLAELWAEAENPVWPEPTWWHARVFDKSAASPPPPGHWRRGFDQASDTLRTRALISRGVVWLIALGGLAFIPAILRQVRHGPERPPGRYARAWPLPLGLVVFLLAVLAWIGFTMVVQLGIATLPALHPAVFLFLDSAARLLPALIALGLLFRRPSHVVRTLGLRQPASRRTLLGWFGLLVVLDPLLQTLLGAGVDSTPGGGLSAGEAGLWGLAFVIVSACLLAPVTEEILYRGVLFQSLRNRLGILPAAAISSVVFAVLHFYDGYGLVSVGLFGFASALLYATSGSLWSCIVLHILYNSSIKIPQWIVYHAPL